MVFLGYAEGTKAYWLYDPRGDKSLLLVPDPKDSVLDQYLATALIQLANADDAGMQLWDVIYIR